MKQTIGSPRRPALRRERRQARLHLEALEPRTLMSVDIGTAGPGPYDGIRYTGYTPPDTIAAAGPTQVVEAVNLTISYYDHDTGGLQQSQSLQSFFSPLGGVLSLSDPSVAYDEYTGQFVVTILDYSTGRQMSRLDIAVSNDADPRDGWYYARYDTSDGYGTYDLGDFPRLGYNADAYVVTLNMFPNGSSFNHVDTLSINKGDLSGYLHVLPTSLVGYPGAAPTRMHSSNPGDPMWLVGLNGTTSIKVIRMDNELSDAPAFTTRNVSVASFSNPPAASQQGSTRTITTGDDRIQSAAMNNGQLVAAHTIKSGSVAAARWYQFDTTGDSPVLVQSGTINQGAGVHTYYPSVEMNYEGDLGMTFIESSSSEYMSMYVTGQSIFDSPNTMQTPVRVRTGTAVYGSSRTGDYSGISIDPNDGYSFWAANEYRGSSTWNTGIANFGVSPSGLAASAGAGPGQGAALATAVSQPPATSATPAPTATGPAIAAVSPGLLAVRLEGSAAEPRRSDPDTVSLVLVPEAPTAADAAWESGIDPTSWLADRALALG